MKRILIVFVLFGIVFLAAGCTTKKGTIYLATTPPGATVYVNKIKQGETPLEFQWDSKMPATLKIEKEGYQTETERLDKGWLKDEYHKGNYERFYQKTEGAGTSDAGRRAANDPVGDTSERLWKVRTSRDLVEIKQ
jgi:hypothetical protein